jgi:murein DD-endopeptidase MepM/ murein hydrolase activator NlpD
MNMQKRDNSILQKVKDNAFYVALGLGLIAILAVVAVYTLEQNGGNLAQNDTDVKTASDYAESKEEAQTNVTSGEVTRTSEDTDTNADSDSEDENDASDSNSKNATATNNSQNTTDNSSKTTGSSKKQTTSADSKDTENSTSKQSDSSLAASGEVTDKNEATTSEQIPVTTDVGELNFNSEKTISWPVSGTVILPYSMDTTVYFKTLDQYRCNPGMLISAGNGTTVQSAYLGQVTKVTSDNTYGNMVTMYLGNNYSVVYGQLDAVYVKEGDFVKEGASVGTIGNPTDSFSKEGSHLFFQMYDGDEPIDPVLFME